MTFVKLLDTKELKKLKKSFLTLDSENNGVITKQQLL